MILTNHHCGYSAIQKLSTTTANHLKNGFWAKTKDEELSAGFSVSFLVKIVDITDDILADVTDENRRKLVGEHSSSVRKELSDSGAYAVDIKEMFSGNKYFAYVYETFGDVRLVGTPPESVDQQRVAGDGGGHRADGGRPLQRRREGPVGHDLTIGQRPEGRPYIPLEGGPGGVQRDGEPDTNGHSSTSPHPP